VVVIIFEFPYFENSENLNVVEVSMRNVVRLWINISAHHRI